MNIVVPLLFVVHGAIHLLGFAKGWGLAAIPALTQPIGRAGGSAWLLAAIVLVASPAVFHFAPRYGGLFALGAIVLSQALVASAWADAKAGTLANLILIVPVLIAVADLRPSSLRSSYERDVRELEAAPLGPASVVTEADLAGLPDLVAGWLRRAGVVGRPHVRELRGTFRSRIRSAADAPWMEATVEQVERFDPPARLFFMRATRMGVPFDAYHRYVGPRATMRVRVAGLLPVVDAAGPEMDKSETVTFFNDICLLAPAALLDVPVTWEVLDARRVRGTYTQGEHTISANLSFDEAGDLAGFISDDRLQSGDGGTWKAFPWSTPITGERREYDGVRLPSEAEARWVEPGGEWAYAWFGLDRVEYEP